MRKDHRQKVVVGLVSRVGGIGGTARATHARARRRAVMTVGDVKGVHGVERGRELHHGLVTVDHPEFMAHPVERRHIDRGGPGGGLREYAVDGCIGSVDQEYRSGLRVQCLDLADPVVFLHGPGELVLLDAAPIVGLDGSGGHQPGLDVLIHRQPIGVVAGMRITYQNALRDHVRQILRRFRVHLWCIRVGSLGQIDLRPGNVQETPRATFRQGSCLGRADNVVGRRHHVGSTAAHRPQAGERLDQGHAVFLRGCQKQYGIVPDAVRQFKKPTLRSAPRQASGASARCRDPCRT